MFLTDCSPRSSKSSSSLRRTWSSTCRRDAGAAGLGQPLQPRRDVHPVAVDPLALDADLAQVHADAELHRAALGHGGVARLEDPLDLGGRLHGIGGGGELGQEVVAGEVHDPAPVLPTRFVISVRYAPSLRTVSSSSSAISREYPTTSAERIAASLRSTSEAHQSLREADAAEQVVEAGVGAEGVQEGMHPSEPTIAGSRSR